MSLQRSLCFNMDGQYSGQHVAIVTPTFNWNNPGLVSFIPTCVIIQHSPNCNVLKLVSKGSNIHCTND